MREVLSRNRSLEVPKNRTNEQVEPEKHQPVQKPGSYGSGVLIRFLRKQDTVYRSDTLYLGYVERSEGAPGPREKEGLIIQPGFYNPTHEGK